MFVADDDRLAVRRGRSARAETFERAHYRLVTLASQPNDDCGHARGACAIRLRLMSNRRFTQTCARENIFGDYAAASVVVLRLRAPTCVSVGPRGRMLFCACVACAGRRASPSSRDSGDNAMTRTYDYDFKTGTIRPETWQRVRSRRERVERLDRLATLLDTAILIPGTGIRFGADAIIGLVPGIGDIITTGLSAYIVYEAYQLGVPNHLLARMIANVAFDSLTGAVPV